MLFKLVGLGAALLATSVDAYGFLRYPPPRRINDRIRERMPEGLRRLDENQFIRMPVDQFPEKLEGINFLCRGIPFDERNVQRYFPGGQIDMMWETGGVQDAICRIKIVCPAKNYEKVLWSGDCATAAGIERRQILIPPDFECRMGECNLVWLMETKAQNSYCDCVDIYVPPCVDNQCTIVTSEESCSTCQPITTVVTIETVSQASTSTMTQTLETTVNSVITTTINETMTVSSLSTSLATAVSISTQISVIEVTETVSTGILTSLLISTLTAELTLVTTQIDTLFETSVIAQTQTQQSTLLTTMLQVTTVTITIPSQVVVSSSVTVTETMFESSTSLATVTMTEVMTSLTAMTLNTTITMVETITNDQTSSLTVTLTTTSEIILTQATTSTLVSIETSMLSLTDTSATIITDVLPSTITSTETVEASSLVRSDTSAIESTSEIAIPGSTLATLSSKILTSSVASTSAAVCMPCVAQTVTLSQSCAALTVTMTVTETFCPVTQKDITVSPSTTTCLLPTTSTTCMLNSGKLEEPTIIFTSTEMPQPTIIFNPDSCEEGMQQCTGERYYKVCIGGKWSEPRVVAPDSRLCCKQYGRIVRIEQVN